MREPTTRESYVYVPRIARAPGRATTVALVVLGLVLGGAVFAVGFLLLLALAAAGLALGAGWVLIHRVKGFFRRGHPGAREARLDPSLQVRAIEPDEALRSRPDSVPRPLPGTERDPQP